MTAIFALTACLLAFSSAYSDGDTEKGKALFNNPGLSGATSGMSCNTCHPDGRGLEEAGIRKEWRMMGKKFKSIEGAINYDIEKALQGKALDTKSGDMADIVAYIKSLGRP